MARCPRCSHEFFSRLEVEALGVEPRIRTDVAAELLAFPTVESLHRYIQRHHREWKLWRNIGHKLVRFLLASQVRQIANEVFRDTWGNPRKAKRRELERAQQGDREGARKEDARKR